jgi:hypothetical protein
MIPWPVTPEAPKTRAVRWMVVDWEDMVILSFFIERA